MTQVAVVTGAASGIGAACARELARQGAFVVAVDIADLQATVDEITAEGGTCEAVQGDITNAEVWQQAADAAAAQGGATCLINVAGFSQMEDNALTLSETDWNHLMNVNLNGAWLGIKHIAPQMQARKGGSIVNMSSAAALIGAPNHAAYSASKGAILALTRQLAVELAPDGIRVNAVCPGPVDTPMVNTNTPEAMQAIVNAVPLKRIAPPEEVAQTMIFLTAPASQSITGVTLPIDGGMSISL